MTFEEVEAAVEIGAAQGLEDAAQGVLATSDRDVPRKSGELEGSGEVSVDGLTAVISYGGPYAVLQHERLDYHHDVGHAKFLEQAPNPDEIRSTIAAAIRAELGT